MAHQYRFKRCTCNGCGKIGHFQKSCSQSSSGDGTGTTHHADDGEHVAGAVESSLHGEEYEMYTIHGSTAPITVDLQLNGKQVSMEVDTGASQSIMSPETFDKLWDCEAVKPKLSPVKAKLRTYTKEIVLVIGSANVSASCDGVTYELPMWVIPGNGPTLLGRNWLQSIKPNWHEIKKLFSVEASSCAQVLDKFPSLFEPGIGSFMGMKVEIHLDLEAKPIFCKARSGPYLMREKIECELERLQNEGVISPVEFNEWASPVVPVLKGDGAVRI